MIIINKSLSLFLFLLVLFFLFIIPPSSYAQTIFSDEFNGNGELHSYNNQYEKISDPNRGHFDVKTDHLEATEFDPVYIYTGVLGDNKCASIDFNWKNGLPQGHWTDIILDSTQNAYGITFSVKDVNGTQQEWIYFGKSQNFNGNLNFDENLTHTLKACAEGTTITGYLDNNLLFTQEETDFSGGYMGFASQIYSYYLDNFKIENIQNNPSLNVPLIKQTSNPWQSQVYDTANKWNPANPSINAFGCALTSAAMVLQYHGIKKLPDGTTLDPGTLNTWLNGQKDGYVGQGLLNWLAISRLSKLAKNINGIIAFDALEYKRTPGANTTQLNTDLTNQLPDILEEPGHFVVAKGTTQNSYNINDPYFDRTDLASYSGTFLSLGRYIPSHTDLSYIMVVVDPNISGVLKNSSGSAVGDTFIQNAIQNPLNPSQHSGSKRIFYLSQPDNGIYTLDLTSPQTASYSAEIYLYDQDGNVITSTQTGIIHGNGIDSITIPFKKTGNDDKKIVEEVTFQSVIQDITDLRTVGDIKKEKLKNDLILLMQKAEEITKAKKLKKDELKQKFEDFIEDIKHNKKKDLSENGYQILLNDIQILKDLYLK